MNTNPENLEKIMGEALELKEKGKTISEILDWYPEYKKELKKMFQTIDILSREKEKILPSKELLTKILSELTIEKSVTEKEFSRYLYRGEKMPDFSGFKGRTSIFSY
jgi:DNA-directed RNA polymerase subunit F